MHEYAVQNEIDVDLIGYVKSEMRRVKNMEDKRKDTSLEKAFPIISESNEWCFEIVDEFIGWHPAIYDIRDEKGKRIFPHNNCLPCKNWNKKNFANGNKHFPDKMKPAVGLSVELKKHWGREAQDIYTTFEKQEHETNESGQTCDYCAFD